MDNRWTPGPHEDCSGNTTYLFTVSQLYTALRFHGFRHNRNTTLARKREGTTCESCDATNTNAGYPRGYYYKSSLFGFLLGLPERV